MGVEQQVRKSNKWGTTSGEEQWVWNNKQGKMTGQEQQVGRNDKLGAIHRE
jgi:hypothetical protein